MGSYSLNPGRTTVVAWHRFISYLAPGGEEYGWKVDKAFYGNGGTIGFEWDVPSSCSARLAWPFVCSPFCCLELDCSTAPGSRDRSARFCLDKAARTHAGRSASLTRRGGMDPSTPAQTKGGRAPQTPKTKPPSGKRNACPTKRPQASK